MFKNSNRLTLYQIPNSTGKDEKKKLTVFLSVTQEE
jgi:hypothetical protein